MEKIEIIDQKDLSKEPQSFNIAFQVSKKHIFEINYYRLGNNINKNFHTSAGLLNHGRTDYNQCGQAQESVLNKNTAAYKFYKKWNYMHGNTMSFAQYDEMILDLEILKEKYYFIENSIDKYINFSDIVELDRKGKFNK